jgi:hypothetical protein
MITESQIPKVQKIIEDNKEVQFEIRKIK